MFVFLNQTEAGILISEFFFSLILLVEVNKFLSLIFCSFIQVFAFDYCFWSMDESNTTKYAGKLIVSLLDVEPLVSSSYMCQFSLIIPGSIFSVKNLHSFFPLSMWALKPVRFGFRIWLSHVLSEKLKTGLLPAPSQAP